MSQVHVKFLSNLQKDFYLLINEVDDSLLPPSMPLPHHLNIIKEKDIYMRAALQLLDQKNLVPSALERVGSSNAYNQPFGATVDPPSSSSKNTHDDNFMHDVIRLGYLKKGARSGSMNIPGSGAHWKRKYVEVRHGLFSYDDYYGGTIYIGNSDIEELTRNDNYHRRSIKLKVENCRCRMLPAKDGSPESKVFEIAVLDGARRLWMASSVDECREWVKSINAAMVGGIYRGNSSNNVNQHHYTNSDRFETNSDTFQRASNRSDPSDYLHGFNISNSGHDVNRIPLERNMSEDIVYDERGIAVDVPPPVAQLNCALWSSIDGAAAPYVADMSTFLKLQEAFLGCKGEASYRNILHTLWRDHTKLTIPVLFIKSKSTHSYFSTSAQDTLSAQNIRSKCSSQVWKDLQRDIIVVNGEQVSGELGAESMLGALVRHLNDKAEALRILQEKQKPKDQQEHTKGKNLGDHCHQNSTSNNQQKKAQSNNNAYANTNNNNSSTNHNNTNSNKSLTSVDFAITEAQIVECAKDLFVLCNRTQSGGDTYFCIEAFLSGDHMKDFCILTPYSAEAEPLEFKIDIVEVSQHLSPAVRQQRATTTNHQQQQQQQLHQSTSVHYSHAYSQYNHYPISDFPSMSRSGYELGSSSTSHHNVQALVPAAHNNHSSSSISHMHGDHNDDSLLLDEDQKSLLFQTPNSMSRNSPVPSVRDVDTAPSTGDFHNYRSTTNTTTNTTTAASRKHAQEEDDEHPLLQHPPHSSASSSSTSIPFSGSSTPSPVRPTQKSNHNKSSNNNNSGIIPSKTQSFTFEDVQSEYEHDVVTEDDNNNNSNLVISNDEEDDEDEKGFKTSTRSTYSKRTALRLSGSGAGSLGLTQEDLLLASNTNKNSTSSSSNSRSPVAPPAVPPRRAQLDLKRELQQEGYLNSVWNTDGTSVKLNASLMHRQLPSNNSNNNNNNSNTVNTNGNLSAAVTSDEAAFSSSNNSKASSRPNSITQHNSNSNGTRPPSIGTNANGVAMAFLDLTSQDPDDPQHLEAAAASNNNSNNTSNNRNSREVMIDLKNSSKNQNTVGYESNNSNNNTNNNSTYTTNSSNNNSNGNSARNSRNLDNYGTQNHNNHSRPLSSTATTISTTAAAVPANGNGNGVLPPLAPMMSSSSLHSANNSQTTLVNNTTVRVDDGSIISDLTFDTTHPLRHNQQNAHNNTPLQSQSYSYSSSSTSTHNLVTSNSSNPSSAPNSSHNSLNLHHNVSNHVSTNTTNNSSSHNNNNNNSNRPLSSGQSTVTGQFSPGTLSQRTSGQQDAVTVATMNSNHSNNSTSSHNTVNMNTTATTSKDGNNTNSHNNSHSNSHHNSQQEEGGILSDGEEYGILDDEGHDSTSSNHQHHTSQKDDHSNNSNSNNSSSGAVHNLEKKKSLLKRLGKKLRPFKMPHLSSSTAAAGNTGSNGESVGDAMSMMSPSAAHHHNNSNNHNHNNVHSSGTRSRGQSDAPAFLASSKDHFQQFLQHLTPKHHHHHHHHGHHHSSSHNNNGNHNDSDRESSANATHHHSHKYSHHTNNNNNNSQQYPNLLHQLFDNSNNNHHDAASPAYNNPTAAAADSNNAAAAAANQQVRYGLRIQVRAKCRYRVCGANPTGFVDVDSWATVAGIFYQSFLLVGDGRSQLGITDRLVTIEVDGCSSPPTSQSLNQPLSFQYAPSNNYSSSSSSANNSHYYTNHNDSNNNNNNVQPFPSTPSTSSKKMSAVPATPL